MRRMKFALIAIGVIAFYMVSDMIVGLASEIELHPQDANIKSDTRLEEPELMAMEATSYCIDGTTATGSHTRSGIAAARRSWFGKTVKVYWNDGGEPGSLIGTYIIEDTGGWRIRTGRVIDIWLPTEEECKQFGRRSVLVEIVE